MVDGENDEMNLVVGACQVVIIIIFFCLSNFEQSKLSLLFKYSIHIKEKVSEKIAPTL